MTTPAEHAATELRELAARMPDAESDQSRDWCVDCGEWVQEHGLALAERATELERERDSIMADAVKNIDYWKDKEYKQRERAEQLERERYSGDDMAEAFQRGRLAERNERDSARQAAVAHMENLLSAEKARAEQLERDKIELQQERYALITEKEQLETALREHLDAIQGCAENTHMDDRERLLMVVAAVADARAALDGGTGPSRVEQLETALREIERMAGAAGSGETPAMPIAARARAALDGGTGPSRVEQLETALREIRDNQVSTEYGGRWTAARNRARAALDGGTATPLRVTTNPTETEIERAVDDAFGGTATPEYRTQVRTIDPLSALRDGGTATPLREEDLRIEPWGRGHPYMGGGYSNVRGVRITHLPTGTVVEHDEEKSQLRNREAALGLLREILLAYGGTAT